MKFQVKYSENAAEQMKKLDGSVRLQIIKRIERLAENPLLAKPLSNELKNYRGERIGKYRIVFSIIEGNIIIARIAHRKTAYFL